MTPPSTHRRLSTARRRCDGRAGVARTTASQVREAPDRTWQELVDIGYLVRLDGVDLDEVAGYFEKHGLTERWHELKRFL